MERSSGDSDSQMVNDENQHDRICIVAGKGDQSQSGIDADSEGQASQSAQENKGQTPSPTKPLGGGAADGATQNANEDGRVQVRAPYTCLALATKPPLIEGVVFGWALMMKYSCFCVASLSDLKFPALSLRITPDCESFYWTYIYIHFTSRSQVCSRLIFKVTYLIA